MNKAKTIQLMGYISLLLLSLLWIKLLLSSDLPEKNFYDTNHIINIMAELGDTGDKAFDFTAHFFSLINIVDSYDLLEWTVFLFPPLALSILILFILFPPKQHIKFYIAMPIFAILISIYTLQISKDFIQFFFYFIILISLYLFQKKILIPTLILLFFAVVFRSYLALVAVAYFTFSIIFLNSNNLKYKLSFLIASSLILFFILQYIVPSHVEQFYNIRDIVNADRIGKEYAITLISNPISNIFNPLLFLINTFINLLRLLFPIELVGLFSPKYIAFVIFQLFISFNFLKILKNIFNLNYFFKQTVIMLLSILVIHSLFEPDFGSFLRHEISFFPFLYVIIFSKELRSENPTHS